MTRMKLASAFLGTLFMLSAGCAGDTSGEGPGDGDGDGDGNGDGDGGGDGGGGGSGGGGGGGGGNATAFRLTDLDVRDPHIYIDALGCQDVTATINDSVQSGIEEDNGSPADPQAPDGLLDFSSLVVFRPLAQGASDTSVEVMGGADCTAPMDGTACTTGAAEVARLTAANAESCSAILADTTDASYSPAPPATAGPCFISDATDGTFNLSPFVLADYQVAATYQGDPATGLASGVLRGFLSEAAAEETVVETPLGEQTVASLLPGGEGNCAASDARDSGPDGESGWYVYLEWKASPVDFTD